MQFPPQALSPAVIPAEQVARLSRWARVALVARAAMRLTPSYVPGPMRPLAQARDAILAVDACSTIAALAAVNGRQLSSAVTECAIPAAIAAIEAPKRVPLTPGDHAAMLAGLAIEWSGADPGPMAIDTGSMDAVQAASDDFQTLLGMGLHESGVETPVGRDFFARPLWPARPERWEQDLMQWHTALGRFQLAEFAYRYQKLGAGAGLDWTEEQQRAEAWVRVLRAARPASPLATPAPSPLATPPNATPSWIASPPPAPPAPTWTAPPPAPPAAAAPAPAPPPTLRPLPPPVAAAIPIPTLRVELGPNSSDADYSDLEEYANALAATTDFLESQSTFTVAIQGAEGSGRSVLASMIEQRVMSKPSARGEQPHLTYWFDAARRREAPTLTAALLRGLSAALDRERPVIRRHLRRMVWSVLPQSSRILQSLIIAVCVLSVAGVISCGLLLAPDLPLDWVSYRRDLQDVISAAGLQNHLPALAAFGVAIVLFAAAELLGFTLRIGRAIGRFVQDPAGAAARGEGVQVRKQLQDLIRAAIPKGSRMFIFVEGLDRAGPERSMAFLEGIDEMFQFPELVFILLVDQSAQFAGPQMSRFIDMEIDLPARRPASVDSLRPSKKKGARSKKKSNFLTVLLGPLSRDWRGQSRFSEVIVRTMYVNPAGLVPLMVICWFFFIIPLWEFITLQRWFYPIRCRRFYSHPGKPLWMIPVCAALLAHAAIVFQTLNSLIIDRHFVIFYPGMAPLSTWVFAPLDLACLAIVGLEAVWSAFLAREQERRTLANARRVLRQKIDQARADGRKDPLDVARSLRGSTSVADGEESLIREAVQEAFLVSSGQPPLERATLFLDLGQGLAG